MRILKKYILTLFIFINSILLFSPLSLKANILYEKNNINEFDYVSSLNKSPYIKNNIIPKSLYIIPESKMTLEERTMISTLQGIVSNKSDCQIYIIPSNENDYNIWLNDLKDKFKVKTFNIDNPWELLKSFKKYINGYIIYSKFNSPSVNNACTLSSLKDALAIEESIEPKLIEVGITNLIEDCRNTDKYWAFDNLWNSGLNHSTVIELSPDKEISLRDYAIMSKSLIFYEDIDSTDLREKVFKSIDENGCILGWGPDEHENVSLSSKYGIDMIAADWSYNLSVLSSFPFENYKNKISSYKKIEDGFHYVTFIMSDGDNQQWLLGNNFNNKNWFGSPYRKKIPLGWSLSPSLYYLAPTVFNAYYDNSNNLDNFLVSPSGNGYMYPSRFPFNNLSSYTRKLNEYMERVNQRYVLILDDESFYKKDLWDKYTINSNIHGLFYLNYYKHNSYNGKIIWSNNKPIVSCRDLLWDELEDTNNLISNINDRVNLGYTKINDPNSYTFVYVHVWSKTIDDVYHVVTELNKNPKVKIVNPSDFMNLIEKNLER